MDIASLALSRVDELERRFLGLSRRDQTIDAFEMRNDNLFQFVSGKTYSHTFETFVPQKGQKLTMILSCDLNFETQTNCVVRLKVFGNVVCEQQKTFEGKAQMVLAKILTIFEERATRVVLEIEAESLSFVLEKYSLNIIGKVTSVADGVISPFVSADTFCASDFEFSTETLPKDTSASVSELSHFSAVPTNFLEGTSVYTAEQVLALSQLVVQ